jgi:hypothetical protein
MDTRKTYLIAVATIFVVLMLMTLAGRSSLEQWTDKVLSYCPAFKAPERLLDVRAGISRNGIDVQLINVASANLRNVKVTIYLPEVDNVNYKDDEVYAFGSYLIKDDIQVLKPGQVKTYHIDKNKLRAGADPGKIHFFAGGYYNYVLNITHFGTDQPLFMKTYIGPLS